MAGTLLSVRTNIREMLRDLNPDMPALFDRRLKPLIERRMHHLALQVPLGKGWSLAAVTLVPGTDDYTISGVQVRQIEMLRLASTKQILTKRTTEQMAAQRANGGSANPYDFALAETATQTVTVQVFPIPKVADTLDRFGSVLPANLTTDASAIPFSEPMLGALEFDVMALCIGSISDEQAGKMQIDKSVGATYAALSREAVQDENTRRMETQRQRYLTLHSR